MPEYLHFSEPGHGQQRSFEPRRFFRVAVAVENRDDQMDRGKAGDAAFVQKQDRRLSGQPIAPAVISAGMEMRDPHAQPGKPPSERGRGRTGNGERVPFDMFCDALLDARWQCIRAIAGDEHDAITVGKAVKKLLDEHAHTASQGDWKFETDRNDRSFGVHRNAENIKRLAMRNNHFRSSDAYFD